MPPSQKIPETPREAIAVMRNELNQLENQPWVRNYQGGATMSAGGTALATSQVAQSIQTIGLGFCTLAALAVETAVQGTQRT
jgi:hypothetical protein